LPPLLLAHYFSSLQLHVPKGLIIDDSELVGFIKKQNKKLLPLSNSLKTLVSCFYIWLQPACFSLALFASWQFHVQTAECTRKM
jgi:hypothetical protein